jgi:hypothetical protein
MSSSSSTPAGEALTCPTCARRYPPEERFCTDCGMPLVHATGSAEEPRSEAHARARKIRPEYSRGDLVRVAGGRNQAEAELIQNLLIEEGVPSVLRRSAGFDVPDFLAAGQRDVLVPESGAQAARELLNAVELGPRTGPPGAGPSPLLLVAAILGGGLVTALIAWLLMQAA